MIDNDGSQKFVNKDKITEPDERVSWKLHGCGVSLIHYVM